MNQYIQSDLYRYTGKTNFFTFVKTYFFNDTFRFQTSLRLANDKLLIFRFIGKLLRFLDATKNRIIIPTKTSIGFGLYIGHGGPIVINGTATIGDNVNLSQYTTIGSNHGKAATIGDNVYIGPNVCVVEDVSIGDNVTIGAGSVVTKDIPNDATAAGNYAKVLNYDNPGRYIKNRWDCSK